MLSCTGLALFGTLCLAAFFSVLTTLSLGATYALYRFWCILKQAETLPDALQVRLPFPAPASRSREALTPGRSRLASAQDFQEEAAALLLPGAYQDEGSTKVRFDGVVKKEDGEGARLNDLKDSGHKEENNGGA